MIKALFIVVALAASGGIWGVYAQSASENASSPSGNTNAAPATSAPPSDVKQRSTTQSDTKREELGQKLMKRKMELDHERLNIQPATARDRARERRPDPPADTKGQQKK